MAAIGSYILVYQFPCNRVLLRLDGQYGTGAVLAADLAGFSFVTRGKDYSLLERGEVQARLRLPPDQQFSRPESQLVRTLYNGPEIAVGPQGERCRVIVATHRAGKTKSRVGVERGGVVYELFLTNLPHQAFTTSDVAALAPPIVVPLNPSLPMKTRSKIPIAGAVTRPAARSVGRLSPNGNLDRENGILTTFTTNPFESLSYVVEV